MTIELSIKPISQDLWTDFEELFGLNGACGGCWCMYWKLRCKAYDESRGSAARQMHKSIVDAGTVTGLLAYAREEVVGWVAVEPRREYEKLAHSHILKPVDDQPVWSVSCFYVAKGYRRQGVTVSLLKAAVRHVKRMGGRIVEGYPVDAQKDMPAPFVFTGMASAFQKAGFVEVARNSPTRPIYHFDIQGIA
jgi:GNAT superfamily N-acetyltransferase